MFVFIYLPPWVHACWTDAVYDSSNGGVFGGLSGGMSIINLPQAAVLGMHEIKDKPVIVNGRIVIRPIMVVALAYDHRVMDGRKAATLFGE